MLTLMAYAGPEGADSDGLRIGGVPVVPAGFTWPRCAACEGNMQFIAQLPLEGTDPTGDLLSIFMCANDPGMCPVWEPGAGANHAFVFRRGERAPAAVPPDGETALGEVSGIELVPFDAPSYDSVYMSWQADTGRSFDVLGGLGGEPSWIQGHETPACPRCAQPMAFVAHLEEGADHTAANFGGGTAYAFACRPCTQGAFLWQCT